MKKLPIFLILLSVFTLGSCASKGWSCTKRYCDASDKSVQKEHSEPNKKVNA